MGGRGGGSHTANTCYRQVHSLTVRTGSGVQLPFNRVDSCTKEVEGGPLGEAGPAREKSRVDPPSNFPY